MLFDSTKSNPRPPEAIFAGLASRFSYLVVMMLALAATPAFSQSASELNDRGSKAYSRGAYDQAVAFYSSAISLNSNDAVLFHNRGLAELKLSEYPAARADFDRAISMRPNIAAFFNSRGGLFMLTRDYSLAVKDFGEAYRLEPLNPMGLENYQRAEAALSANTKTSPSTQYTQPPPTRCTIGGIPRDVLARIAAQGAPEDFSGFKDDGALAIAMAHQLQRDAIFGGGLAKYLDMLRSEKTGLPPCGG